MNLEQLQKPRDSQVFGEIGRERQGTCGKKLINRITLLELKKIGRFVKHKIKGQRDGVVDKEDFVQEAALRMLKKDGAGRLNLRKEQVTPYMKGIAAHVICDHLKEKEREKEMLQRYVEEQFYRGAVL